MGEDRVVLGLGSNLGRREANLKRAINRLTHGAQSVLRAPELSRVYESPALLPPRAPAEWDLPYLNCGISGEALVGPEALLHRVREIERSLGRREGEKWAPRVVDIDILWWPGRERHTAALEIPHAETLNRAFVLKPLRDLVPDDVLRGRSFRAHAERRSDPEATAHAPESEHRVLYPELMGILNVTPDSFSDGGRFPEPGQAIDHARGLLESGATIIDLGGESTRPGGSDVTPAIEWARIGPVLAGLRDLRAERTFRVSLDSRHPETVRRALEVGIDILNDVTGFSNPSMMEIAQGTQLPLVCMHSLSIPVVKGEFIPDDSDPLQFLLEWGRERLEAFDRMGVGRERLILDPGIGFGKTSRQNWQIVGRVEELHELETPLLVGHSRKSFFELVTDKPSEERDPETRAVSDSLARKGVEILRIHDVKAHDALFRSRFLQTRVARPQ